MTTFWDKQPEALGFSVNHRNKNEPEKLPDEFEWSSQPIEVIYEFLKNHYVSEDDFKLMYGLETLKWALEVPGHQNVAITHTPTQELVGFISVAPLNLKLNEKEVKGVQGNFLCVHTDYRSRRIAPYLISEAKRVSDNKNRKQAIVTIHNSVPGSIAKATYWHRIINIDKLIKSGFYETNRPKSKTFEIHGRSMFRKVTPRDVSKVKQILKEYFVKFKISPAVNDQWIRHWLLPREDVIYSYINDETGDFFSFYSIPYEKIDKSYTVKQAYLFYMTGDNFNDAFIMAKNEGFDVFNALDIAHNEQSLVQNKFIQGTGYVNYHIFNWDINTTITKKDINVTIP